MRNTIVITGGLGYIGQALIRSLSEDKNFNKKLIIIDRGMFVNSHTPSWNQSERFQYVFQPLSSGIDYLEHCKVWEDVETIIHLSGISNDPMADFNPQANHKFNFLDTSRLVDNVVLKYKVPRFVFASSASVYGMSDQYPLSESAATNPAGNYGQSKLYAENHIESVYKYYQNLRYVVLRKGTVMGVSPRMRFDLVVNTMVKDAMTYGIIKLIGGGETWRPLVSIHDVVNIYKKFILMTSEEFLLHSNCIYNVVQDNYRMSELALKVKYAMKKAGIIHPIDIDPGYDKLKDIRSYRILGNALELTLKYKPEKDVTYTVVELIGWLLKNCTKEVEDDIYYNIRWLKNHPQLLESI